MYTFSKLVEAVASRGFKQWEGRCSDGREEAEIHQHQHASIEQTDREGWILSHSPRRGGPTTASCTNLYSYLMSEEYQKSPFLKVQILIIKISKRVSRPSLTNVDFFVKNSSLKQIDQAKHQSGINVECFRRWCQQKVPARVRDTSDWFILLVQDRWFVSFFTEFYFLASHFFHISP